MRRGRQERLENITMRGNGEKLGQSIRQKTSDTSRARVVVKVTGSLAE